MAVLRLALFFLAAAALFYSGVWVGDRLRGPRAPHVVRYHRLLFGAVPLLLAAVMTFCTFRIIELPGWEGNGPWVLAVILLGGTICWALTFLRAMIIVTPSELILTSPFRSTPHRIALSSVTGWHLRPELERLRIDYTDKSKDRKDFFALILLEGKSELLDLFHRDGPR